MSFSFRLFTGQPTGASFSRTALCYDGANALYGTSIIGGQIILDVYFQQT